MNKEIVIHVQEIDDVEALKAFLFSINPYLIFGSSLDYYSDAEVLPYIVTVSRGQESGLCFYTFGQSHKHEHNGIVYDKDCVIAFHGPAKQGRILMDIFFNDKWAFEYTTPPDMSLFPRGFVPMPKL